jgi:glycine/D-amino acid oxidase-like deaminating enzyme
MTTLRLGQPIWLDEAHASGRRYPALSGTMAADVTVVGAGITGTVAAWRLAQTGARVVLLEAARAARGSTAASTALLMQEPDEDLLRIEARYGRERAQRIWRLCAEATREFIDTIRRLRISCDLSMHDSIYYTLDADAAPRLKREHEARRRCGSRAVWLDRAALRRSTAIDGLAAIRTHGNAEVNPVAATLGFLDAARGGGVAIFEKSPVRHIETEGAFLRVKTPRGTIQSSRVVVATGYATREFKPLVGRFRMMNTYVVATTRIPRAARRALHVPDVMLWDTARPYHYARWTRDGRLLLGGGDRPRLPREQRARALARGARNVREHFEELFPALRDIETAYAWEGLFATTPDGLPYIGPHRSYPKHLFALGYGGNGMTFAFLAARLIAERVSGEATDDHELFAFGRASRAR